MEALVVMGLRSGSISVPNKNIQELCGYPLFFWALKSALNSSLVSRVIVSTNSVEYAEIVSKYHSDIIIRPECISGPKSYDYEYLSHALKYLADSDNYFPDIVIRSLATAPFQLPEDYDSSLRLLEANPHVDSVHVVSRIETPADKLIPFTTSSSGEYLEILDREYLRQLHNLIEPKPRQSMHSFYYKRSNLIVSRATSFVEATKTFCGTSIMGLEIPSWRSYDIDSLHDLLVCGLLMKEYLKTGLMDIPQ